MPQALDELMESASQALADMDYARCETLCGDALRDARQARNWAYYRRIVLPLQEARRQKRQAAIDGPIMLGIAQRPTDLKLLLPASGAGCVALTRPATPDDARVLAQLATEQGKALEVLYADNAIEQNTWTIQSFRGPAIQTPRPAPDPAWRGVCLPPNTTAPPTPAHWFMQASEALGDAALASIEAPTGSIDRVVEIEGMLEAAGDHELLHQALADAAYAAHEAGA